MDIAILHFQSKIDSAIASKLSGIIRRYREPSGSSAERGSLVDRVLVRSLSEDLAAPSDLDELSREFEKAGYAILLCSKRCKESAAFMRIVSDRIAEDRGESLLFLITEGDPGVSFPKNLVELLDGREPMAANVVSGSKRGSLKRLKYSEALRIVSPIVGREYRELRARFDKAETAKRRLAYAAIALLSASSSAWYALESSSISRNMHKADEYRILGSHLVARIAASAQDDSGAASREETAIARILGTDDETMAILDQYREEAGKDDALASYGIEQVEISKDLRLKLRLQGLLKDAGDSESKARFSSGSIREGVEELGLRLYVMDRKRYLREIENVAAKAGGTVIEKSSFLKTSFRRLSAKIKSLKLPKLLKRL